MADTVTDKARHVNLEQQTKQTDYQRRIAEALEAMSASSKPDKGDSFVVALVDNTAAGFKRAMKLYMQLHGITDSSTAEDITNAVTGFYTLMKENFPWDGGTTFYDPDVSSLSTGVKFGDNEGLTCTPSSADTKGQDDYEGIPLFACTDVNWTITDGDSPKKQITAIEGIVGDFKRYDTGTFVGVLQMSGYHYYTNPHESSNQTYTEGYRTSESTILSHCEPLPEAIEPDGTVLPWVIHAKYPAGLKDGKFTCCSGIAEEGWMSHNNSQTYAHAIGTNYSGMCSCDLGFLQIMTRILFGSLTLDGILELCNNYQPLSYAQVAETGVKRVILAASEKEKYIVGSNIIIGNGTDTDWNPETSWNISGKNGLTVTAVDDITINDTKYCAVYVDSDTTFDTAAGNTDNKDNTQVRSTRWKTGSTDSVPGNTGAIKPTGGKYPVKLQGVEFGLGAYEVSSDTILKLYKDTDDTTKYYYEPYTVKLAKNQSSDITANYASVGVKWLQPDTTSWQWVKASTWGKDGVLLPTEVGGSSSTYMRDQRYSNAKATGTRECLAFGSPGSWVASGGLSCLFGGTPLGGPWWDHASRLSPNGNRG